jgi:hypothetical protein
MLLGARTLAAETRLIVASVYRQFCQPFEHVTSVYRAVSARVHETVHIMDQHDAELTSLSSREVEN